SKKARFWRGIGENQRFSRDLRCESTTKGALGARRNRVHRPAVLWTGMGDRWRCRSDDRPAVVVRREEGDGLRMDGGGGREHVLAQTGTRSGSPGVFREAGKRGRGELRALDGSLVHERSTRNDRSIEGGAAVD